MSCNTQTSSLIAPLALGRIPILPAEFVPRRLMVLDEDFAQARRLLKAAAPDAFP